MATNTVYSLYTLVPNMYGQWKAYLFFSTLLHRAVGKIRSTEIFK